MSCSFVKGGWEVRWRDSTDRQRSRRFQFEEAAREFDGSLHEHRREERSRQTTKHGQSGGVYPYATARGTMWRFVARRTDGTQTSKRGFASEKTARDARRRLIERQERGEVRDTKETFASFWEGWLARRKAYLQAGTWQAYERDGRLRLLPALGPLRLSDIDVARLRTLMDEWVEAIEEGTLAPKTINNTMGTLVVCLNGAVEDGLLPSNPALRIPRLPSGHIEREFLRLHEIPLYLECASTVYRPLAELLIGSGLRISEALGLKLGDLELEPSGGVIVVYRSRKTGSVGSTKSGRFRSVEIGRGLSQTLSDHVARRNELTVDAGIAGVGEHVFVMPTRTRKRDRGRWQGDGDGEPMDRTTVSRDWHKATLQDAGLRDMPLHALRHTAAASWLAAGNSLIYVQRQLGHADIGTTERYYGHLERHVLAAGSIATEEAIASAVTRNA